VTRPFLPLTPWQQEILQAVADGDTYAEIADAHFMTKTGISSVVYRISRKLGATNTPNAIALAYRKRIIT
jgi:DNA-binding NarL/FixJ family response regulator